MNDTELLKKIHAQVKNHRKKNLSNQLISEILDHKFDDFSASNAKRVVELEKQNAELRKERNELNKLNSKIVRIADAIKTCFPCLTVCDGVLFVKIDGYNKLVEVMNDEY